MSGFFLIKKKIFKKCKKKLYGKGFKILFDIIYSDKTIRISDYQIKFNDRLNNQSKMNYKVLINLVNLFLQKLS